jgi:hypothetical protein
MCSRTSHSRLCKRNESVGGFFFPVPAQATALKNGATFAHRAPKKPHDVPLQLQSSADAMWKELEQVRQDRKDKVQKRSRHFRGDGDAHALGEFIPYSEMSPAEVENAEASRPHLALRSLRPPLIGWCISYPDPMLSQKGTNNSTLLATSLTVATPCSTRLVLCMRSLSTIPSESMYPPPRWRLLRLRCSPHPAQFCVLGLPKRLTVATTCSR